MVRTHKVITLECKNGSDSEDEVGVQRSGCIWMGGGTLCWCTAGLLCHRPAVTFMLPGQYTMMPAAWRVAGRVVCVGWGGVGWGVAHVGGGTCLERVQYSHVVQLLTVFSRRFSTPYATRRICLSPPRHGWVSCSSSQTKQRPQSTRSSCRSDIAHLEPMLSQFPQLVINTSCVDLICS